MADRTKTIGVRVTPDEYEKFENHVEETNEFDTLSRFLRVLAHRHIAMDGEEEEVSIDSEEIVEAVDVAVSPLAERLDQLEDHILAIDANVGGDDDLDKLARELYLSLPTHSGPSELPSLRDYGDMSDTNDLQKVQSLSTPYLWAQYFDVDLGEMRRACARMLEYYPDAQFVDQEVDARQSNVEVHGDIDIAESSEEADGVDITYDNETGEVRSGSTGRGRQKEVVRRYYKTEEA